MNLCAIVVLATLSTGLARRIDRSRIAVQQLDAAAQENVTGAGLPIRGRRLFAPRPKLVEPQGEGGPHDLKPEIGSIAGIRGGSQGYSRAAQTPQEALKRLRAGNKRFVKEAQRHPDRTIERRQTMTTGQSPYAVIVTCSDSRVAPEAIFDEGLGNLFTIQVAGNVVGPAELESILYAVDHLDPVIIVVMGHQNCGAVGAVVEGQTSGIPEIAKHIETSVNLAKSQKPKNLLRLSIVLNALGMRTKLLKSPSIDKKVQDKSIAVYGAYYHLPTGKVDIFDF